MIRLNEIIRIAHYEYQSIIRSFSILLVMGGGVFVYGLLYNYMYSPNVLREVPIMVVDESHTPLSRHYIRLLDASPQVFVKEVVSNIPQALEQLKKGMTMGIIYLPKDFEAKLGRGEESVFVTYNTTLSFLIYEAIMEASIGAMLELDGSLRLDQVVFLNADVVQPVTNTRSIQVQGFALYNESGGYATYLSPSVLMVIIFQTMLIVISMLCGKENEQRMKPLLCVTHHDASWGMCVSIIIGKSLVYVGFYALFSIFLVGLLPLLFNLPHLASPILIIQILIPYLFATAFLGLSCKYLFNDSDAPLLLIAFFSVGLLFLSGISWPLELMPLPWRLLHCLIPAPVGILAFVKANSMGADMSDISMEMMLLWGQCIVYFGVACWVYQTSLKQAK